MAKIPSTEIDWGLHYPWDIPEFNKVARFFAALKESRIETTKCKKCNSLQWPPRSICSKCLSMDLEWMELPKEGVIDGFSLAYVGLNENENAPMIVATIKLDPPDSVRLLARINRASFDSLRPGLRVKLDETGVRNGKPYWAFRPVQS